MTEKERCPRERDNKIILLIKENNQRVFVDIYKQYHDEFIYYWRKRYSWIAKEDSETIFHDCIIALNKNVQNNKIELPLKSSLKHYLYTIGHNKFVDLIIENKKYVAKTIVEFLPSEDLPEHDFEETDLRKIQLSLIDEAIDRLSEICKTILIFFWDQRISDKDIINLINQNSQIKSKIEKETNLNFHCLSNYKSADSLKTQRSRCMQNLKECATS